MRIGLSRGPVSSAALTLTALLIAGQAAQASLTYKIEVFSDSTFTTSQGGYTTTGDGPDANDQVQFKTKLDASGNATLSALDLQTGDTLALTAFGGATAALFKNIKVTSSGNSSLDPIVSQLVSNETDIASTSPAAIYFQITSAQDGFDQPNSPTLLFQASLSVTQAGTSLTGAQSQFKSTLTTPSDAATLPTLGFLMANYSNPTAGPLSAVVTNTPPSTFTITNVMRIGLNAGARITSEGSASVAAIATPEPSTAIAALAGAPLLVLGAWIRRRKAQA